jgi:membrane protein YdbS with pleckstrin-like domain
MRNLIGKFQSYWLADASFVTLLIMLVSAVFVLPIIMEFRGARRTVVQHTFVERVFFRDILDTQYGVDSHLRNSV